MNVCFLTIHAMTPFYREIAARLEHRGHRVSWISPSAHWSRWLVKRGVDRRALLDLTAFAGEWTALGRRLDGLDELERRSTKSVRDLILMDRLMVERDESTALAYAAACVRHAGDFLESQGIEVVFAEPSYLLAYVVAELSEQRGIRQFAFDTVRFPDGRFGIFQGIYQERLASEAAPTPEDRAMAAEYHARFHATHEKPISYYSYLRPPRLSPILLWKVVRNARRVLQDPHDESGFPVGRMIRDQLRRSWNYQRVRRWGGLTRPTETPDRPFVLYGLHKQPELGLDVLASYLSNQEELVRVVARSLPISHDFYVKPHANDLGGRSRAFFERLSRIPGVRIIDPLADSHALIRGADLVLSVTGTMAYEGGLYGRRAITFAPMFFAPLMVGSGVDPYALRIGDVRDLLDRPHPKDDAAATSPIDFLATVIARSYPGVVGDPLVDPRCMEPANVDLLGEGFDQFLRGLARHHAGGGPAATLASTVPESATV